MSNVNFMYILGIKSNATQEEITRALAVADRETATLQLLNQRTAAQEARLRALKEAMDTFMAQYGGNTTTTNPNPPDYSVEGTGTPTSNTQAQPISNNSNAAPDPTAGQDTTNQQPQGNQRERMYCEYCVYSSIHQGHFDRHVQAHRRG